MSSFLSEALDVIDSLPESQSMEGIGILLQVYCGCSENLNLDNDKKLIDRMMTLSKSSLEKGINASASLLSNIYADFPTCFNGVEIDLLHIAINNLLTYIANNNNSNNYNDISALLGLISNLTISESNSRSLIDWIMSPPSKITTTAITTAEVMETSGNETALESRFEKLLKQFLNYNPQSDDNANENINGEVEDDWQYMSNVICNMVRDSRIKKFLLQASKSHNLIGLLSQFKSRNVTRRRGCVGTVRSLLFDNEYHWWLITEMNITNYILAPLILGEFSEMEREGMDITLYCLSMVENKIHEPEEDILMMLLECVILLCQKRYLRDELRKRKVYPVIKNLDLKLADDEVTHDKFSEIIRNIVDFLMRDESFEAEEDNRKISN